MSNLCNKNSKWGILGLALVLVFGCDEDNSGTGNEPTVLPSEFFGVSLSPRSMESDDFLEFYDLTRQTGNMVTWAGDWISLADTTSAPAVVAILATDYDYYPLIVAGFFDASDGTLRRPLNDANQQIYLDAAEDFADRFQPPYLCFGNELNILFEHSPADYDLFVEFFPEVVSAVKTVSPETKVFTAFQLERLKGLRGGLFGGVNDTTDHHWDLIGDFPDADLLGLTSYPGLIYRSPEMIPAGYYSEIQSRTDLPIALIELGWHSVPEPLLWASSEIEQADFVELFFSLTRPLHFEITIWSFMYDPATDDVFNSMGLRRTSDGGAKLAWDAWTANVVFDHTME